MSSHTTRLLLVAVVYQDEDPVRHSLGIQVPGLAVEVHCGAGSDLSLQAACHVHIFSGSARCHKVVNIRPHTSRYKDQLTKKKPYQHEFRGSSYLVFTGLRTSRPHDCDRLSRQSISKLTQMSVAAVPKIADQRSKLPGSRNTELAYASCFMDCPLLVARKTPATGSKSYFCT